MELFRKGKIGIIAEFHRTDLDILSHSRGRKPPSYSQINTVAVFTGHLESKAIQAVLWKQHYARGSKLSSGK